MRFFRFSVFLAAISAGVTGAFGATLSLAAGSGSPGTNLTLPISLSGSNGQVSGLEWTLSYSATDFSRILVSTSLTNKNLQCAAVSTGQYTCLLSGFNQTAIPDGTVATATLTIASGTNHSSSVISAGNLSATAATGLPVSINGLGATETIQQNAVTLSSISCSPATVTVPGSAACTVTGTGAAPSGGLTVSLGEAATGVSLTLPASVTIPAGSTQTTFTAQVTAAAATSNVVIAASSNGTSKSCTLTAEVVVISISPASSTLVAAQQRQFTTVVSGSTNTGVTWSLNPATGTVSSAGLYTAPAVISRNQSVTVTAKSAEDPTKTASAIVSLIASGATQSGPPASLTVSAAGPDWGNLSFPTAQTGSFTAEVDARPSANPVDVGIGLSDVSQNAYTGLACIARFNSSGFIDARNGGSYAAAAPIKYAANTAYHFRFVVNIQSHTYSVYVTPAGQTEQTVGTNYAFRTEQQSVSVLNNWALFAVSGSQTVSGFLANSFTATSNAGWTNSSFSTQSGSFQAQWDAAPLSAGLDAVMALSAGAQTSFSGFASLVRFWTDGSIQVRNGGNYSADTQVLYSPNTIYHFRLVVNVPLHIYSVFVTPPGGTEQTLGSNYAFRTEQSTVGLLNSFGVIVNTTSGALRVGNLAVVAF